MAVSDMLSISMLVLAIKNDKMQGRTATTNKRFELKYFLEAKVVLIRRNPLQ